MTIDILSEHEAAHVVVALALGLPVFRATVVASDGHDGKVDVGDRKVPRWKQRASRTIHLHATDTTEIVRHVAVSLAGYVHERTLGVPRQDALAGATIDLSRVLRFRPHWRSALRLASTILLRVPWAIEDIANRLAKLGTICDGRTFRGWARTFDLEAVGFEAERRSTGGTCTLPATCHPDGARPLRS